MELTIIIPTYNRHALLAECLQAVDHFNAEILVVDDGSIPAIEPSRNVRVVRHDRNRGRAAALNTGLRNAAHDMVLLLDDDIFPAPDMAIRLADEFRLWSNTKLAIAGRISWDPDLPLTMTMRWIEESGPFQGISSARSGTLSTMASRATILWRPWILERGGFDETFAFRGMEDVELGLRLKPHGLETRLLSSALGYRHKTMKVRDLVTFALTEGRSAISVRRKIPDFLVSAVDSGAIAKNRGLTKEAAAAVDEIMTFEQEGTTRVPAGAIEHFNLIYRHYFLQGVSGALEEFERGDSRNGPARSRATAATRGLYDQATHLASNGEWGEARRLFRLVRERSDETFWPAAAYQLGVIESTLGNAIVARNHFMDCVLLDPGHRDAQASLQVGGE